MRIEQGACAGLVAAGIAFCAGGASAQDAATGAALFDKGVADMHAEHFDTGCPALEESERLDPHPGTLFTLAECQAQWGKVASAVAHYEDYVGTVSRLPSDQQARHRERAAAATAQVAKLKPTVPTLALVLPPTAPAGTIVSRNGMVLQAAALGLALPVDPGDYVIVTHVPGAEDKTVTISVALSETKRVSLDLGALVAPAPAAPAPPAAAAANAGWKVPKEAPKSDRSPPSSSNVPAYVVGGIGVAGIALGSVTGILVFGKKSALKSDCTGTTCSAAGVDAANSAKTLAIASDIGFGVGIAGLATAAILLLTHSKTEQAARPNWQAVVAGTPGGAWAGLAHRW